jgi:hypothetical protein
VSGAWDAETFAAQARALAPQCIERLAKLLQGDDPAAAIEAIKLVLAYGFGAPVVTNKAADDRPVLAAVPVPRWRS